MSTDRLQIVLNIKLSFIRKTLTNLFIVVLIVSWVFSGWPHFLNFPPTIHLIKADDTGALTAGANAAKTSGAGDNNGFETTPTNTTSDNGAYAVSTNTGTGNATDGCATFNQSEDDAHDFYNFGISIPASATINGIQVDTNQKWSTNTGTNQLCIELSWNGGTNWTSTQNTTGDVQTSDSSDSLGGAADTWGRTWTSSELSDANFRLRVMIDPGGANTTAASLDYLAVTVTYTVAPTVTTQAPSSITETTATLNGNITATGGASATVRGFAWGTDSTLSDGNTATTTENGTFGTGAFTGSLTNLTCNTTYYSRAYATNSVGTGYGSIESFNTSSCSASLTFTVTTDNFPNLTPGTYVFATSTLSADTDNSGGWNVTLSRDDTDTTLDLSTDATVNIVDQTDWVPGADTSQAGNGVRMSLLDNSGDVLAFRVMTASGTASFISTAWWGNADAYTDNASSFWSGIPDSGQQIGNSSSSSGGSPALNTVLYYLDVPSTQKTGTYDGGITFTATMN